MDSSFAWIEGLPFATCDSTSNSALFSAASLAASRLLLEAFIRDDRARASARAAAAAASAELSWVFLLMLHATLCCASQAYEHSDDFAITHEAVAVDVQLCFHGVSICEC